MPDEPRSASRRKTGSDYLCDIGVAASDDGIRFERVTGPVLRRPEDWMFSFENVNCIRHEGRYYMFLSGWVWGRYRDRRSRTARSTVSEETRLLAERGLSLVRAVGVRGAVLTCLGEHSRQLGDEVRAVGV